MFSQRNNPYCDLLQISLTKILKKNWKGNFLQKNRLNKHFFKNILFDDGFWIVNAIFGKNIKLCTRKTF